MADRADGPGGEQDLAGRGDDNSVTPSGPSTDPDSLIQDGEFTGQSQVADSISAPLIQTVVSSHLANQLIATQVTDAVRVLRSLNDFAGEIPPTIPRNIEGLRSLKNFIFGHGATTSPFMAAAVSEAWIRLQNGDPRASDIDFLSAYSAAHASAEGHGPNVDAPEGPMLTWLESIASPDVDLIDSYLQSLGTSTNTLTQSVSAELSRLASQIVDERTGGARQMIYSDSWRQIRARDRSTLDGSASAASTADILAKHQANLGSLSRAIEALGDQAVQVISDLLTQRDALHLPTLQAMSQAIANSTGIPAPDQRQAKAPLIEHIVDALRTSSDPVAAAQSLLDGLELSPRANDSQVIRNALLHSINTQIVELRIELGQQHDSRAPAIGRLTAISGEIGIGRGEALQRLVGGTDAGIGVTVDEGSAKANLDVLEDALIDTKSGYGGRTIETDIDGQRTVVFDEQLAASLTNEAVRQAEAITTAMDALADAAAHEAREQAVASGRSAQDADLLAEQARDQTLARRPMHIWVADNPLALEAFTHLINASGLPITVRSLTEHQAQTRTARIASARANFAAALDHAVRSTADVLGVDPATVADIAAANRTTSPDYQGDLAAREVGPDTPRHTAPRPLTGELRQAAVEVHQEALEAGFDPEQIPGERQAITPSDAADLVRSAVPLFGDALIDSITTQLTSSATALSAGRLTALIDAAGGTPSTRTSIGSLRAALRSAISGHPDAASRTDALVRVVSALRPSEVGVVPRATKLAHASQIAARANLLAQTSDDVGPGIATTRAANPATDAQQSSVSSGTAAAVEGSRFHGDARRFRHPRSIRRAITAAMSATDADHNIEHRMTRWSGADSIVASQDGQYVVTSDSGQRVLVELAATNFTETADGRENPVARFEQIGQSAIDGEQLPTYRVEVSDRALRRHIPRALAHEIAEILQIADGNTRTVDALSPEATPDRPLRPGDLSPHDHGRLAELRVIAEQTRPGMPLTRRTQSREFTALLTALGLDTATQGPMQDVDFGSLTHDEVAAFATRLASTPASETSPWASRMAAVPPDLIPSVLLHNVGYDSIAVPRGTPSFGTVFTRNMLNHVGGGIASGTAIALSSAGNPLALGRAVATVGIRAVTGVVTSFTENDHQRRVARIEAVSKMLSIASGSVHDRAARELTSQGLRTLEQTFADFQARAQAEAARQPSAPHASTAGETQTQPASTDSAASDSGSPTPSATEPSAAPPASGTAPADLNTFRGRRLTDFDIDESPEANPPEPILRKTREHAGAASTAERYATAGAVEAALMHLADNLATRLTPAAAQMLDKGLVGANLGVAGGLLSFAAEWKLVVSNKAASKVRKNWLSQIDADKASGLVDLILIASLETEAALDARRGEIEQRRAWDAAAAQPEADLAVLGPRPAVSAAPDIADVLTNVIQQSRAHLAPSEATQDQLRQLVEAAETSRDRRFARHHRRINTKAQTKLAEFLAAHELIPPPPDSSDNLGPQDVDRRHEWFLRLTSLDDPALAQRVMRLLDIPSGVSSLRQFVVKGTVGTGAPTGMGVGAFGVITGAGPLEILLESAITTAVTGPASGVFEYMTQRGAERREMYLNPLSTQVPEAELTHYDSPLELLQRIADLQAAIDDGVVDERAWQRSDTRNIGSPLHDAFADPAEGTVAPTNTNAFAWGSRFSLPGLASGIMNAAWFTSLPAGIANAVSAAVSATGEGLLKTDGELQKARRELYLRVVQDDLQRALTRAEARVDFLSPTPADSDSTRGPQGDQPAGDGDSSAADEAGVVEVVSDAEFDAAVRSMSPALSDRLQQQIDRATVAVRDASLSPRANQRANDSLARASEALARAIDAARNASRDEAAHPHEATDRLALVDAADDFHAALRNGYDAVDHVYEVIAAQSDSTTASILFDQLLDGARARELVVAGRHRADESTQRPTIDRAGERHAADDAAPSRAAEPAATEPESTEPESTEPETAAPRRAAAPRQQIEHNGVQAEQIAERVRENRQTAGDQASPQMSDVADKIEMLVQRVQQAGTSVLLKIQFGTPETDLTDELAQALERSEAALQRLDSMAQRYFQAAHDAGFAQAPTPDQPVGRHRAPEPRHDDSDDSPQAAKAAPSVEPTEPAERGDQHGLPQHVQPPIPSPVNEWERIRKNSNPTGWDGVPKECVFAAGKPCICRASNDCPRRTEVAAVEPKVPAPHQPPFVDRPDVDPPTDPPALDPPVVDPPVVDPPVVDPPAPAPTRPPVPPVQPSPAQPPHGSPPLAPNEMPPPGACHRGPEHEGECSPVGPAAVSMAIEAAKRAAHNLGIQWEQPAPHVLVLLIPGRAPIMLVFTSASHDPEAGAVAVTRQGDRLDIVANREVHAADLALDIVAGVAAVLLEAIDHPDDTVNVLDPKVPFEADRMLTRSDHEKIALLHELAYQLATGCPGDRLEVQTVLAELVDELGLDLEQADSAARRESLPEQLVADLARLISDWSEASAQAPEIGVPRDEANSQPEEFWDLVEQLGEHTDWPADQK